MIRKIILILIVIFEQMGISSPLAVESPVFDYSENKNQESYVDEINIIPEKILETEINLEARAFISLEPKTFKVLIEKDSNIRIPIASLTKVMTAVIILENSNLEDEVVVSDSAVSTYGLGIGLRPGEHFKLEDLLYAALLNSSNDASVALAEHISGSEEKFVVLMNKKAKDLGLSNTNFKNCTGFDEAEHYSSIYDLAKLTRFAMQKDKFSEIVAVESRVIISKEGLSHYLSNSNKLTGGKYNILGVKTGFTDEAGQCLITLARSEDKEALTIVLNSPDRFGETQKLLDWSFKDYQW